MSGSRHTHVCVALVACFGRMTNDALKMLFLLLPVYLVPGTVVLSVDVACRVCVNAKEDVSLSHNLLLYQVLASTSSLSSRDL